MVKQEKKRYRKDFFLEELDVKNIEKIKLKIGALSESQAVRYAIRELARKC